MLNLLHRLGGFILGDTRFLLCCCEIFKMRLGRLHKKLVLVVPSREGNGRGAVWGGGGRWETIFTAHTLTPLDFESY